MAGITTDIPTAPEDEVTHSGRPVRALTTSLLMDAFSGLIAGVGLRVIPCHFEMDETDSDSGHSPSPNPRVRWVSSPFAKYVYVGIWYYAEDPGGSTSLQVNLQTSPAGVLIDSITFDRDSGLRFGAVARGAPPSQGATYQRPAGTEKPRDEYIDTGWAPGVGSTPRMLDLGSNQGTDVEVALQYSGIRIYSVTVIEYLRTVIT